MVREQDVLDYLNQRPIGEDTSDLHFALKDIAVGGVTLPAGLKDKERGKVDAQFIDYLRANLGSFAQLPSLEKCQKYREHGAVVGEGVLLGPGAVIVAPQIVLGDGVRIAGNSTVQCRELFAAGQLTSFREGLAVRGGTVVLGENVYAGSNIQIGGGGNADPWALLCVGDMTYLGDDVFINICRPVLIGKEVFLTQRSLLVTHNIGHSVLEGYENRFAPIVLEDYSQIGMNCTVYAGASIGRAAIVGSNSYVISSIPAGKLAMGVPARVIRDAARPLTRERQVQIVEAMIRQYHELLSLKGYEVSPMEIPRARGFALSHGGKRFQLIFVETYQARSLSVGPADETVIWTLEAAGANPPSGCSLVDLLAKTISGTGGLFLDSTREFLRKRGIRCQPGPWRYEHGLI
jgi:acetyltransferase-like isoleucine patch superfamily enzyme